MTCPAGMFIVNLIDQVLSGYSTLFVCLVELIVIAYIYGKILEFFASTLCACVDAHFFHLGVKQFARDIKLMIGSRPNWYWLICWGILSPAVVFTLTALSFKSSLVYKTGDYVYPLAFQIIAHLASTFPVSLIFVIFVFMFCTEVGCLVSCFFQRREQH